jgi:hypothetical protein
MPRAIQETPEENAEIARGKKFLGLMRLGSRKNLTPRTQINLEREEDRRRAFGGVYSEELHHWSKEEV